MSVRPLGDRILVKRLEADEKTPGGLFIPDTAKEKPQQAEVVAVGTGKVMESGTVVPLGVKAGDRVLMSKYGGTEVTVEGQEVLVVREDDILGVIEE